jgi:hypothetical protein
MYKLRNGNWITDPMFDAIIDEFNKSQARRMQLLLELLKEQNKKKRNRRKMTKNAKKNLVS